MAPLLAAQLRGARFVIGAIERHRRVCWMRDYGNRALDWIRLLGVLVVLGYWRHLFWWAADDGFRFHHGPPRVHGHWAGQFTLEHKASLAFRKGNEEAPFRSSHLEPRFHFARRGCIVVRLSTRFHVNDIGFR